MALPLSPLLTSEALGPGLAHRPAKYVLNSAGMADPALLEAEVSGLIALAGLMLVFLPFFLDRVRAHREASSAAWNGLFRLLIALTGLLVLIPCLGAALGLMTLWGAVAMAAPVGFLSLIALLSIAAYTLAIVVLENTVWWTGVG